MAEQFPLRKCKSCGYLTTSTSTIDFCPQCGDADGLRPKHFLTRDAEQAPSQEGKR